MGGVGDGMTGRLVSTTVESWMKVLVVDPSIGVV